MSWMDELRGDRATWQFDGRAVSIQFHSRWSPDPVLAVIGRCEVPVPAISAVDFRPGEKRQDWSLRLRLQERADPYVAVGGTLAAKSDPFRLSGRAKTRLVAEYWADEIAGAASHVAGASAEAGAAADAVAPAASDVALRFVPPVPFHIQTSEGTGSFDGATVRLVWSGSNANRRKRQAQRREFALADLTGAEWVPSDGWETGYLRVITPEVEAGKAEPPKRDLNSLLCDGRAEEASGLLMAAAITAHLWASGPEPARALPAEPTTQAIYERIRELGRLHAEGILTDDEFTTKKAELLARL
jgi:hypothetical protein